MLRSSLFFLLTLFTSLCYTQNTSSIDFTIKNLGLNVDGHFNKFSIVTTFDSADELMQLSGKIDVKSINTGIESRDKHLLKKDYFDAVKHEYITFKSTKIEKIAQTKYTVKINLKIKSKTKAISIPLQVSKTERQHKITSNFEINRKDFDVGGSSFVMGKTIKVNVVYYQKI